MPAPHGVNINFSECARYKLAVKPKKGDAILFHRWAVGVITAADLASHRSLLGGHHSSALHSIQASAGDASTPHNLHC